MTAQQYTYLRMQSLARLTRLRCSLHVISNTPDIVPSAQRVD